MYDALVSTGTTLFCAILFLVLRFLISILQKKSAAYTDRVLSKVERAREEAGKNDP